MSLMKRCLQAVCHESSFVRSAAQAGLSEMPYPVYQTFASVQQTQICDWIWHACQHDSAAAVRAAAVKCLGHVAEGMPWDGCQSGALSSSLRLAPPCCSKANVCLKMLNALCTVRSLPSSYMVKLQQSLIRLQLHHQGNKSWWHCGSGSMLLAAIVSP